MSEPAIVTAAVLVIGNEILSGRTKDANLGYLATELTSIGIRLSEARVVADVPEAIIKAVNELRAAYDYVFTTGGIGPTHDDITSECVARAFGVPLIKDPRAVKLLTNHYGEANLTEAKKAVLAYGRHLDRCNTHRRGDGCDCGLEEVRSVAVQSSSQPSQP